MGLCTPNKEMQVHASFSLGSCYQGPTRGLHTSYSCAVKKHDSALAFCQGSVTKAKQEIIYSPIWTYALYLNGVITCLKKKKIKQKSESHSIISKMSRIQLKTTLHTKNQENQKLNEKRRSIDTNAEMIRMLELSDKVFKAATIKMSSFRNYEHS